MAAAGYRPPLRARNIPVAGRPGIATLEMMLVNMKEGGFISAHDYRVARSAAIALCGGDVEQAVAWLKEKGLSTAAKKAGREKSEAKRS